MEARVNAALRLVKPKKLTAFAWYGGKNSHLKWLLPLLPKCGHYVEPYGGSAAVLLNREPSTYETYNDINQDVYNFFKVLREQKDELLEQLKYTPYSRQEFGESLKIPLGEISNLEKARRFYVRIGQSFMSQENTRADSNWSYSISSCGGTKKKARSFANKRENLKFVVERLALTQIENRPALYVIEHYDTPDTLFYVDPTYLAESRTKKDMYKHEMTTEDYVALASALNGCEGKVALSAYEHPFVDNLFPPPKWRKTKDKPRTIFGGGLRTEILYTNYEPLQSRPGRLW
ncbi:MAG: DNA adenine methylase [Deltaproteobacteria bacterium]|jgi:DNA adenine methylase|nr:DNA adenine methylase [Deltaproteobacteria bacterium]